MRPLQLGALVAVADQLFVMAAVPSSNPAKQHVHHRRPSNESQPFIDGTRAGRRTGGSALAQSQILKEFRSPLMHIGDGTATPVIPASTEDVPGWWHGQAGQDYIVHALFSVLPSHSQRFFVDLAANHAVLYSNTRTLERDHGWRGLCIEGNMALLTELLQRRTCKVVGALVGGRSQSKGWFHISQRSDGFSSVAQHSTALIRNSSQQRALIPLHELLTAAGAPTTIDYLSLDVRRLHSRILDFCVVAPFCLACLCLPCSRRAR